jgi:hypothetical protein
VGQGQNVAGVTGQTASELAKLAFGGRQLRANNAINTGNTVGNSRSTGINNLTNLVGLGLNGAAAFNTARPLSRPVRIN